MCKQIVVFSSLFSVHNLLSHHFVDSNVALCLRIRCNLYREMNHFEAWVNFFIGFNHTAVVNSATKIKRFDCGFKNMQPTQLRFNYCQLLSWSTFFMAFPTRRFKLCPKLIGCSSKMVQTFREIHMTLWTNLSSEMHFLNSSVALG